MKYLPNLFTNEKYFEDDRIFSRELIENERWFMGAEDRLEYFFKNEYNTFLQGANNPYHIVETQTKFWKTVGGDVPRIHSGVPKLATNGVVTLITYAPYEFIVNPDSNGEGSKEQKERLVEILKDNNFRDLFKKMVAMTSWAGHSYFKISHDKEITNYPILEVVSPKDAEVSTKRGRIIEYIFKTRKNKSDSEVLEIHEIWSMDKGKANVEYKAMLCDINKGDCEDHPLPDDFKDLTTDYKIDFIPAILINNTAYNSRFPNSPYGESDYTNVQGLFHMLDDMLSQVELEISNAQAMMFVNEKLFTSDESNKTRSFDRNKVVQEILAKDMEMNEFDIRKLVSILQAEIRVEKYEKTIHDTYARILTNMGLSPITLGLPNFEAINASDKSQREREKSSLRKRKSKLEVVTETLSKLFEYLLKYDDFINDKSVGDYEISVTFDDYAIPTLDDQIDTIVKGIGGRAIDIRTGVKKLFPKLTDEELDKMVQAIKLENGTPLLETDIGKEIEE